MEEEEENIEEKALLKYPIEISYECNKKILEQMEKYICKININENQATGFFCKFPIPNKDKMLHVYITNNHIINEEFLNKKNGKIKLDIKNEEDYKKLDLNDRKTYTNKDYDVTIIEIKEADDIKNYLELDDIIINYILNEENNIKEYIKEYKNETLYIIQYPINKLSSSFGVLSDILESKKYEFYHTCCTREGSSGSPILNLKNKLIGIHKLGHKNKKFNIGTFLNFPIKDFIQIYYKNDNNDNKINNIMNENNININNNELLIKEFSEKYYNIENKKDKLNLGRKKFGNKGLEDLCKIEFKDLTELNLIFNNISDISALKNFKCEKLEILYLNKNKIADISVLEKVNFIKLKTLNLTDNIISNIKVLEKVKFQELEVLDLSNNQIFDINIFVKVNFKKLRQLFLQDNLISNVNALGSKKFENLILLDLKDNPIIEEDKETIKLKLKSLYDNLKLGI